MSLILNIIVICIYPIKSLVSDSDSGSGSYSIFSTLNTHPTLREENIIFKVSVLQASK